MAALRAATLSDLPALNRIEREALAAFDPSIRRHAAGFPPLPADAFAPAIQAGLAWVAETEGQVAGFLAAEWMDGDLFIQELSVSPGWMRRGLGTRLLHRACAQAMPHAVVLTTFRDVPFNAPWYARHGFLPVPDAAEVPGLRARLAAERSHWHGVGERIAMRRPAG